MVAVLPQTCNAAFRPSLLARHVHQKRIKAGLLDRAAKTVILLIASVFGFANHDSIDFNPAFFGMFGTSNGPNHWVFVDRKKDDCRLHSADGADRNRNDGNDFLSTVFHNDRTSET